jgi:hypothetical protein
MEEAFATSLLFAITAARVASEAAASSQLLRLSSLLSAPEAFTQQKTQILFVYM